MTPSLPSAASSSSPPARPVRPGKTLLLIAWFVGLTLVVASGVAYRLAWQGYLAADRPLRLAPGTLARLPLRIDDWVGQEETLPGAVVAYSATDDHLSRMYTGGPALRTVSLFIGYGARPRDLMPHRPEVCYPVTGWALEQTRPILIEDGRGGTFQCQLHHFRRSGLQFERISVLSYWIVDGERRADVSGLRWQLFRPEAGQDYVVQVHVGCASHGDLAPAEAAVKDFAQASAAAIHTLLEQTLEESDVGRPTS